VIRYRAFVQDSARWEGFRFRPDDIVISTPPKCGTTWTQMICGLLILQRTDLGAPLSTLSPWLDMLTRARRDVFASLEAQTHRRFIKTHTPLDGLPSAPGVTFVCVARDPRDVALSMDGHRQNVDAERFRAACVEAARIDGVELDEDWAPPVPSPGDERERFWRWVDDDAPAARTSSSLRRTMWHLCTFWDRRADADVVLLHYDELQADLEGSMRELAARLGIDVPEALWPELVAAARFEAMKRGAATMAPTADGRSLWRDDRQFFRRGTSGQWRDLLDEDDLARYRRRVASLARPEVAAWAHGAAGL
jgi:aryl sulfotransferase